MANSFTSAELKPLNQTIKYMARLITSQVYVSVPHYTKITPASAATGKTYNNQTQNISFLAEK